jgi:hypothetical protein
MLSSRGVFRVFQILQCALKHRPGPLNFQAGLGAPLPGESKKAIEHFIRVPDEPDQVFAARAILGVEPVAHTPLNCPI